MDAPAAPPPRWGPLFRQTWPQDENRVPRSPGLPMPPVSVANAQRSRRESFTMPGTIQIPVTTPTFGTQFNLYLPTDPDGDFWCDQITVAGWASFIATNTRPPPATIYIADARTGRALTYPQAVCLNFFTALQLYSDDGGFDPASSPFPDGFRSTTTLPQPFCFTRSGGIQITMTMQGEQNTPADSYTMDIGFNGWKEYESAST